MKIFTLKTLIMSALLCVGLSARGADETIDFTTKGYTNQQEITSVTGTDCTIAFDKGTNSNAPKYYTNGTAIRAYGGNTMTVSSTTKTITKIELTFGSSDGSNAITTDVVTYENGTWTGNANSVKFTIGGTTGNRRLAKVAVTYYKSASPLASIALSGDYKTTFVQGEAFTHEGAEVTATYEDESTSNVTSAASFSTPDMTTAGEKTVTVSYTENEVEKTTSYTINVYALSSISLSGEYPTTFKQGDTFSHEGLIVTANYGEGENIVTRDVTGSATFSDCNMNTVGNQTVTVSYTAGEGEGAVTKTAAYTITVIQLTSIALSGNYKTEFYTGDAFSSDGIIVTATYSDNSEEVVTAAASFSEPDMTTVGEKTVTVSYTKGGVTETATYTIQVDEKPDYATLPFSWTGGSSSDFNELAGVTTNGIGSDYAASNAPYRIKFDTTGDYIQIKTDVQITKVTIGVKMLGGAITSTITVQESADGSTFTDVQTLTISGKQNDILNLETTNAFNATYRYVRLVFDKGSNVGVGPITINGAVTKTISDAGYATFCSDKALDFSSTGLTAYIATYNATDKKVSFSEVTSVPANTGVLLKGDEGSYNIPVVASSATDVAGNVFVGVTENTVVPAGIFVLLNGGQGVGFYQTESAFTVGANTAYISVPSGVKARFIGVEEDDDATAITAIEATEAVNNGVIYNLSGQRVVKPLKGIYIQNGKKFIVK